MPLTILPDVVKITLADANARGVTIPKEAGTVSLYFVATAGTVAFTGTDGAAATANSAPVPADSWHQLQWGGRGGDLFVAGQAAAVVWVLVEPRR